MNTDPAFLKSIGLSDEQIAAIVKGPVIEAEVEVVREEPVALSAGEIATRETPTTRPASERSKTRGPSIHSAQSSQQQSEGQNSQHSDEERKQQGEEEEHSTLTSASARARLSQWQRTFLEALEASEGHVGDACDAANCSRASARKARDADPVFAAEWEAVVEKFIDGVEKSTMTRAKSDPQLAQFILKTRRRPVYGDKVEVNVSGQVNHLHLHATPDQLAEKAAQIAPLLAARAALYLPRAREKTE